MKKLRLTSKNLRIPLSFVVVALLLTTVHGQAPDIKWENSVQGSSSDLLLGGSETSDGGFVASGYTNSGVGLDKSEPSRGGNDIWVVKMNPDGTIGWEKTIGGPSDDLSIYAFETDDGGYLVTGYSFSSVGGDKTENSRGGYDYWIIKLSASGSILWDRRFGGNANDILVNAIEVTDGYILVGYSVSAASFDKTENSRGGTDYWVVKTDKSGNKLWDKTIGSNLNDFPWTVLEDNGNLIIGGWSPSAIGFEKTLPSKGSNDYWIVVTDSNGNVQQDYVFGGNGSDTMRDIVKTDDGFALCGYSNNSTGGDKTDFVRGLNDVWLIKTDDQFNKVWDRNYGSIGNDLMFKFDQTIDENGNGDGFFITTYSNGPATVEKSEPSFGGDDYWVFRTDAAGNLLWDKTIGGNSLDRAYTGNQTPDGEYTVGGYSSSSVGPIKSEAPSGNDYWIVRLNGDAACAGPTVLVQDITIQLDELGFASISPLDIDNGTSSDCGEIITLTIDQSEFGCSDVGSNTVTLTAVDEQGKTGSATAVVTVLDITPPLVEQPEDIVVECDQIPPPQVVNADDACGVVQLIFSETTEGDPDVPPYNIVRTWTAIDVNGNSTSVSQTIEVQDTTPPVITGPADVTIECDADTSPESLGMAVAQDICSQVTINFEDIVDPGSCAGESVIIRTWTATDASGNEASAQQVIQIVDTTSPVITVPADVTISCEDSTDPASLGEAVAEDNCEGIVSISFNDVVNPGNCPGESTITRTWTATDECGNSASAEQTITVVDVTAPDIIAPADVTISCTASTDPGVTGTAVAEDACGENVTIDFTDQTIPGECPGNLTITRVWTATDACGNSASTEQLIQVVDDEAPVITAPPDVTISCEDRSDPSKTGEATAQDQCGVAELDYNDTMEPGSCPGESIITRLWIAVDECGNTSTASQQITIIDNVEPALTVPADVTISCSDDSSPASTGEATATDGCSDATISFSDNISTGECDGETLISRTWTATDLCGNSVSEVQQIIQLDTEGPVISGVQPQVVINNTQGSCSGVLELPEFEVSDACSDATVTVDPPLGSILAVGEHSVIITARDGCGNQTTAETVVVILDTEAPSITAPDDISITVQGSCEVQIDLGDPVVEDNCDAQVSNDAPEVFTLGTTTVTWTAVDAAGNTATSTQAVTVLNEIPVIVSFTGPEEPVTVGAVVTVNAVIEDNNTESGVIHWGDGTSTEVDVVNGAIEASHEYSDAGVYLAELIVEDLCGESATATLEIPVTDPVKGKVYGFGWFHSEAGNYLPDPFSKGKFLYAFLARNDGRREGPRGHALLGYRPEHLFVKGWHINMLVISGATAEIRAKGWAHDEHDYEIRINVVDGDFYPYDEYDEDLVSFTIIRDGETIYHNDLTAPARGFVRIVTERNRHFHNEPISLDDRGTGGEQTMTVDYKAYPNPFVNRVNIEFATSVPGYTQVKVYSLTGVEVATLFQGETNGFDAYSVDYVPAPDLPEGIYLLKIESGNTTKLERIIYRK